MTARKPQKRDRKSAAKPAETTPPSARSCAILLLTASLSLVLGVSIGRALISTEKRPWQFGANCRQQRTFISPTLGLAMVCKTKRHETSRHETAPGFTRRTLKQRPGNQL